MKLITWPLRIILLILFAILASLNTHETVVNLFLGHQWHAPLAVMLLIAFAAGALMGVLALTLTRMRLTSKNKLLQQSKPDHQAIITNKTA